MDYVRAARLCALLALTWGIAGPNIAPPLFAWEADSPAAAKASSGAHPVAADAKPAADCCAANAEVVAGAGAPKTFRAEGPWHFFGNLFSTADFPARWYCGNWSLDLGWLHVVSDFAIFAAYFAIPVVLLYFMRRKKDLPFPKIIWLFAAFILSCGFTHLVEAGIFWWPVYRFSGLMKLETAVVSWITVFAVIKVLPYALKLPNIAILATQLKDSRERLAIAMNAAHIGVLEWNAPQLAFEIDSSAARMLGMTALTRSVTMASLANLVHPEDRRQTMAALGHAVTSGELLTLEFRTLGGLGEERHLKMQGRIVESVGEPRFVGVCIDTTDEKQSELKIRQAKEQAESANRSKSEFLANMSHEIRTPLGGILGFTDLLRLGENDPQQQRAYLEMIHTSGQHLLTLINDILDISKIEAGRMEFEQVACSPTEILGEVLSIMRVRAQEKGLRLELQWTTPAPETIVTDSARVRQLLVNLLGNAVKFTDSGIIVVRAAVHWQAEEPRFVIEVEDTGIGISPEQQERIFQPFDQADNSITRRFGGTGLGLAISRHIAEGLGGDLSVKSIPGIGSTFRASLATGPLDNVKPFEPSPTETLRTAPSNGESIMRSRELTGIRVLLVEDGETNRMLISRVMNEAGATVTCAENGKLGVEAYQAGEFDVVLMDMQMPVMDGYAAARALRAEGCSTPILALTAHAMRGDREKCLEAGCSEYLSKPINIPALLMAVAHACGDVRDSVEEAAIETDTPTDDSPIHSTLAESVPELRDVVAQFVKKGEAQLQRMQTAFNARDWELLVRLAHDLKGSGGTMGFACLTQPSLELENAASQQDVVQSARSLEQIASLTRRLVVN